MSAGPEAVASLEVFVTHRSALAVLALAAALTTAAFAPAAHADGARPPIGHWVGVFQDGGSVELYVQGNGDCMYGPTGYRPTVGTCTWSPSSVGGILTITYYNAGFRSHAYYSVTWLSDNSFILSAPYFRVVMQRR
jgi:hypothetical protein